MAQRRHRGAAFGVGRVLGRSFSIWLRNLAPFTILSVIVYSPLLVYAFVTLPTLRRSRDLELYRVSSFVGGWLLGMVVTSALIYGVLEQLRAQRVGMGACLRVGFTRLLPVVGVAICVGAIMFCVAFPFLLLVVLFRAPLLLMLVAAFVALIILSRYWLAVPVAVVERPGVIASLRRSSQLTRGAVGSIFLVLLVLQVLQFLAGVVVGLTVTTPSGIQWATVAVTVVLGTLTAVANAVGYHDLRVAKEGVGIEDLVRVFA
jgi:hypothetical protein